MYLSRSEQLALLEKAKAGDMPAIKNLMEANSGLVYHIVNSFCKKICDTTHSREALLSYGFEGLVYAIETFELSKNTRFSTHATRCIYQEVCRGWRESELPLGWKTVDVKRIPKITLASIYTDGHSGQAEDSIPYVDTLYGGLSAEDEAITKMYLTSQLPRDVDVLLGFLSNRQRYVIEKVFGIGCDAETQVDISNRFGTTRQNISRIVNSSINKLRKIVGVDVK